jgi:hypothetical protein
MDRNTGTYCVDTKSHIADVNMESNIHFFHMQWAVVRMNA